MPHMNSENFAEGGIASVLLVSIGYVARTIVQRGQQSNDRKKIENNRDAQEFEQLTKLISLGEEAVRNEHKRAQDAEARADSEAKARRAAQEESAALRVSLIELQMQVQQLTQKIDELESILTAGCPACKSRSKPNEQG